MIDAIRARFIEEAEELIADLEKAVLSLEQSQENIPLVEKIFRVMHTLKGSGSMFGFENVSNLTHELETIYDLVREGKATVSKEILNVTLLSVDHLKYLLRNGDVLGANEKTIHEELSERVRRVVEGIMGISETKEGLEVHPTEEAKNEINTYFIIFRPGEKILKKGSNPLYLIEDLAALGEHKITAHCNDIPAIEEIVADNCYVFWDIYLATNAGEHAIKDVFMFVEDDSVLEIHKVSESNLFKHEQFVEKINNNGEGYTNVKELKEFIDNLLQLLKNKSKGEEKSNQAVRENSGTSIRVASEKLDHLMNLVSELITTQARLTLLAEHNDQPELVSISENIEKISRQLRDNAFSICLVPIETLVTRYKRLVRDLSAELNKEISFVIEGGDTELDKTIIENLTDPLLHILRNSIDHGIESKEQRVSAGKPAMGTITFRAYYYGNNVHIQIRDDGAGIDTLKVRKKAIAKGLINESLELSEKEVLELIFLPGFSTAEKITGVSGRGVGMDVVKRKIQELRGELEVESKVGQGSSITIKLPLTLSIIDGLLVEVGGTFFVIPLLVIEKCYEVRNSSVLTAFNNQIIVGGEKIPFIYLRDEFEIAGEAPDINQVITIIYEGQKLGIIVDSIIGENQAVLKPLGKFYKNLDTLAGATILGDGTIALVLDTNRFINFFSNKILT